MQPKMDVIRKAWLIVYDTMYGGFCTSHMQYDIGTMHWLSLHFSVESTDILSGISVSSHFGSRTGYHRHCHTGIHYISTVTSNVTQLVKLCTCIIRGQIFYIL